LVHNQGNATTLDESRYERLWHLPIDFDTAGEPLFDNEQIKVEICEVGIIEQISDKVWAFCTEPRLIANVGMAHLATPPMINEALEEKGRGDTINTSISAPATR
jgi:hypothetical protein